MPELSPLALGLIVGAAIFVGSIAISVVVFFSCRAYHKRVSQRIVIYLGINAQFLLANEQGGCLRQNPRRLVILYIGCTSLLV